MGEQCGCHVIRQQRLKRDRSSASQHPGKSSGSYLDLSEGAGGDLVILQRRRRNGPAGVEGLWKRGHLGSGRDLHAGKLGGIELLRGRRRKRQGVNIETQQTFKDLYALFSSRAAPVCLQLPLSALFYVFPLFPRGWQRTSIKGLNCISKAEPRERQQS